MAQVACVLNAGLGHALGVHVVIADVNIVPVLVGFAGGHRSRVAVALQLVDLDCVEVVDVLNMPPPNALPATLVSEVLQ